MYTYAIIYVIYIYVLYEQLNILIIGFLRAHTHTLSSLVIRRNTQKRNKT